MLLFILGATYGTGVIVMGLLMLLIFAGFPQRTTGTEALTAVAVTLFWPIAVGIGLVRALIGR